MKRAWLVVALLLVGGCLLDVEDDCPAGEDCKNTRGSGDVGTSCAPEEDPTSCNAFCLGLNAGGGVCIDSCGPLGKVDCPTGYKCNTLPSDNGGTQDLCLPNASCGALTYQGNCDGSVLNYCGYEGPISLDCAERRGENNEPMRCAVVNDQIGANCVSSTFSSGCGQETEAGRCDGNTVVYCESVASGNVRRQECGNGQVCGISDQGIAECRAPGTSGCGSVSYQGYCDGSTVVWCQDSAVQRVDCAMQQKTCGFVDNETGYWCVETMPTNGSRRVRGRFLFEKRALTVDGLGGLSQQPARSAQVKVLRSSDHQTLATGLTLEDGTFSLTFDADDDAYVAVFSTVANDRYNLAVRDCPEGGCNGGGSVYGIRSADFTPSADHDLGALVIREASGSAGAFNIFDVMLRGLDFAWANYNRAPPPLTAQWVQGEDTSCGTSCFSSRSNTIYVLSRGDDADEYDDPVLLHEFGHYLESAFSRSDSPGGAHDGSPTDPRLAWGEGYGTFVGCAVTGSPLYIDSRPTGATVTDISETGMQASPSGTMRQLLSEYVVAEALWRVRGGQGTTQIFDVLGSYLPSSALVDRGVSGVDFVDFLDGWFCRGHGVQSFIQGVVNQTMGFPYDYAGPSGC